ncbi:MAG TPA: PDDEXK nuclease domain-containing protein, partial [Sediminibacterium sp.]
MEEALFYIQETTKHNWPRKMLDHHLSSGLYERKGRALTNFDMALPLPQAELAREMLKNPYNLGFLEIDEEASERDLENAIINNIVFLQEIGPWFALMGKQYKLRVSEQDYFIDLLFYHTRLHCYLVIELKITEFIPEYAGKLEFYINAIDEQIKLPEDNQTIGLLLYKNADKIIVEYSLRTKTKPTGVAEYTHTLPRELVKELPTVTELRKELQKEIILAKKPIDEKLARIKDFISRINIEESREEKSDVSVHKIYTDVFLPL